MMKIIIKSLRKLLRSLGFEVVRLKREFPCGFYSHRDFEYLITKSEPIIFDVGGNVGQTAKAFLKSFPRGQVHTFEPASKAFEKMSTELAGKDNLIMVNKGLGAKKEERELNLNELDDLNSFLAFGKYSGGVSAGKDICELVTCDDYAKENNITQIDLLKIDTQGFEMEVLKGAKKMLEKGNIEYVFLEVNFLEHYIGQVSFIKLLEFFKDVSYELITIYPLHYENSRASWTNALFRNKASSSNT